MKHVVQFSGGKDSTCMLLMMLEKGMPVDEIIFCDTGMEFPGLYKHIEEVRQYIRRYGKDITFLKAEHEYEWYMFDKPIVRGKYIGSKGYGWPAMDRRWCTRELKIEPTQKYLKDAGETITYIGIASDEPKRHFESSTIKHPLFEWGISEKKALSYCKEHGFTWGGLYEKFRRVSCWCCPLQNLASLRILYHDYPELWERLKDMDKRVIGNPKKGHKTGAPFRREYGIKEIEERFRREDNGKRIAISLWENHENKNICQL